MSCVRKAARRRLARCMPADDLANILTALAEQYERNAIELEAELWEARGGWLGSGRTGVRHSLTRAASAGCSPDGSRSRHRRRTHPDQPKRGAAAYRVVPARWPVVF